MGASLNSSFHQTTGCYKKYSHQIFASFVFLLITIFAVSDVVQGAQKDLGLTVPERGIAMIIGLGGREMDRKVSELARNTTCTSRPMPPRC
jgi:hypothetical protein